MKRILEKIGAFIFNRSNLMLYYGAVMLYCVMPFYYDTFFESGGWYNYTRYIWWAWTILIFLHDFLKRCIPKNAVVISWLVFFLTACLSYIFVPDGAHGIAELSNVINLGMMVYLFVSMPYFCTKEEYEKKFRIMAMQAVIVITIYNLISIFFFILWKAGMDTIGTVNLWQFVGGRNNELRYFGLHSHPIMASGRCMLAIVLTCFLKDRYPGKSNAAALTAIVSSLIMILLSNSRFSLVEALIFLIYCLVRFVRHKPYAKWIYAALIIAAATFTAVFHSKLSQTFYYIAHPLESPLDQERFQWWMQALQAFEKRPLLGWGWYSSVALGSSNAHNALVNILVWSGIAGFATFIAALVISIVRIIRNRRNIVSMHLSWLTVLMACVFTESMVEPELLGVENRVPTMYFWLSLGYLCFCTNFKNKESLSETVKAG